MGIDVLDIVFRVEKAFAVKISIDDLTGLERECDIIVGDLFELVLKKMHLRDVGRFDIRLNHRLWLEIRSDLHSVTDIPLGRIELETPLETLFPRETRREKWDALRSYCPYRIRALEYPQIVPTVGLLLAAGVVLIEQFQIWQVPGAFWFWPLLGLFGIWMVCETYLKILAVCAPLRNRFPPGLKTAKELCREILAANYIDISADVEIPFDQRCMEAWEQLTEILAEALGIDRDAVKFRSRLVRDLGMS